MKHTLLTLIGALTLLAAPLAHAATAPATLAVGKDAPAIQATDTNGKPVDLASYKGKIVVLEWNNNDCPFVKKHYDTNNMQDLQKYAAEKNVIWIQIVSSAPDKQGHVTAEEANKITADRGATITHKILDPQGKIGHAYDARTTPHMFVIDKDGKVAYMGAIDSDSSFKPDAIKGATNYVRSALESLDAGKPVTTSQTEPYGCGVKY